MGDNLKQKMLGALAWSSVDRLGQQVVQFVITLILARLLNPTDFGLLGMVAIFAALSYVLVESGFGQALIRKQDASETDYNTVFYFNIFTSLLLYLILFAFAPYIAVFFHQPKLVIITRISFLAILCNAFYLVPFTQLVKEMDFKSVAKVNLISTALSGILGIIFALMHLGVWSLVIQQLSYHFFRMVLFHFSVNWRPKWTFSFQVIRDFWKFSVHLLGTSILNVVFTNIYSLILGRFYPVKEVGFYNQSNKLCETFNYSFQQVLLSSTFTLFTHVQNDNPRLIRIFREVTKKTSIVTFPVMMILIAIAHPFIYVLLTAKWIPSVSYFQLLCFASLFTPFYVLNMSAMNARGKSKITFGIEIIKKSLIILSVLCCFRFGVIGLLWGYVLSCFISYLISTYYIKKDIHLSITNQIRDLLPNMAVGIILAIVAFSISLFIAKPLLLLICQIIVVSILYILYIRITQPKFIGQIIGIAGDKLRTFLESIKERNNKDI